MKSKFINIGLIVIFLCFACSCKIVYYKEISALSKTKFDTLSIKPKTEVNDLRIDLIRQSSTVIVNETTIITEDIPYNPVGFDLGNGLFFDLSQNLSINLEYLLNFSADNDFEIIGTTRPEKNNKATVYKFENDTFSIKRLSKQKNDYNYIREIKSDSVIYKKGRHLKYIIHESDSLLVYGGKRKDWDIIHKLNDNQYYINKRNKNKDYLISGNKITLGGKYSVSLVNDGYTIEINQQSRKKEITIYKLEKSENKLFIYDKRYSGLMIEKQTNTVNIYSNKKLISTYHLQNKKIDI